MVIVRLEIAKYFGYCFINDKGSLPQSHISDLDEMLSTFVKNHEWTDAYNKGEWDGRFRMLKQARNGNYYFPVGAVDEVKTFLDYKGHQTVVKYPEFRNIDLNWVSGCTLRPYQNDILRTLVQNSGSGTIEIPTGAGKTLIALKYAYLRQSQFMVIVHRKELLHQWKEEIEKHFGITPTIVGDGLKYLSGNVVVAMVQTLHRMSANKRFRASFPLIIFDEVHTIPARTAYYVASRLGSRWRVGLSATARRTDGLDKLIHGVTGTTIGQISVENLVNQGFLAKPVFFFPHSPISDKPLAANYSYQTNYKNGITLNTGRNELIATVAKWGTESGRLVFINVRYIAHGKELNKLIEGSVFVSAKSEDRKERIEEFRKGIGARCIISTLLKEGVDAPMADMYINAAAGQSFVSTIQSAGRTLRPATGKQDTIMVDFIDEGNKYLINDTQHRLKAYEEVYGPFYYDATFGDLNENDIKDKLE